MASCENGNPEMSLQARVMSSMEGTPRISPQTLTNPPPENSRNTQQDNLLHIPGQHFSRFRCSPQDTPRIPPHHTGNPSQDDTQTGQPVNLLQVPGQDYSRHRCSPRDPAISFLQVPGQDYSRFQCSPQDPSRLCSPPPNYHESLTPRTTTPLYLISTPILSPRSCYDPPSYQDIYPSKEDPLPKALNNHRTILINVTELHDSRNPNWLPSLPIPPPGVEVTPPRNRSYRERMRYLRDLQRYTYKSWTPHSNIFC